MRLGVVGPEWKVNAMQRVVPGDLFQVSRRPPALADPGFKDIERMLLVNFKRNDARRLYDPRFICFGVHRLIIAEATGKGGRLRHKNRLRSATVAFINALLHSDRRIAAGLQLLAQVVFPDMILRLVDFHPRAAMLTDELLQLRAERQLRITSRAGKK